jgi:asparagine synthetase B (glutamine-hydrolysing)
MCGIAGYFLFDRQGEIPPVMMAALGAMAHR